MAGSNYVLDKGFLAIATYASSDVNGVQAYRFVKSGGAADTIDRQTLASLVTLGVVQEDVDVAKVATGKVSVDVRLMGISKVVAGAAVTRYTEVMSDTTGRAITAVTAANRVVGLAMESAANAGEIIDVWLALPIGRVL